MPQESEAANPRPELPMRLTRLRVKNFRSITNIDIPLSPLTVLVGPNGSGKSNVVDALRFVRDVFARGLDQAVMDREGMGVIQRWGTGGEGITIGVDFFRRAAPEASHSVLGIDYTIGANPAVATSYSFSIAEDINKVLIIKDEELIIRTYNETQHEIRLVRAGNTFKGRSGNKEWIELINPQRNERAMAQDSKLWMPDMLPAYSTVLFPKLGVDDYDKVSSQFFSKLVGDIGNAVRFLNNSSFYVLNLAELRQPQHLLKTSPLDEKGRNLAAVLRQLLINNDQSNWETIKYALQRAVAGFNTLQVEPVGGYLATKLIYQTSSQMTRDSYIGQESDGTVRMLGLLAALTQQPAQQFLAIEEPEANIHPGALAVLAGVLDEASLRSQVLVTTHSPDMLDHLPAESFLVVEKVGDTTHVGPLDASQLASVRKRLFTPGELLRMEGLHRQPTPDTAA